MASNMDLRSFFVFTAVNERQKRMMRLNTRNNSRTVTLVSIEKEIERNPQKNTARSGERRGIFESLFLRGNIAAIPIIATSIPSACERDMDEPPMEMRKLSPKISRDIRMMIRRERRGMGWRMRRHVASKITPAGTIIGEIPKKTDVNPRRAAVPKRTRINKGLRILNHLF